MTRYLSGTTLILAGGGSRRMGQDKATIEISGERLIDIVVGKVLSQCPKVIISGPSAYGHNYVNFIDLPDVPAGPAAAIFTAAYYLRGRADGFFTVPVDGPDFPDDLFLRLHSTSHSSVARDVAGRHPTFGWWRMSDIERQAGRYKRGQSLSLNALADACQAEDITWPGQTLFFNINSANDLRQYLTENTG